MSREFDLDVTFDDSADELDFSTMPVDSLIAAISALPEALQGVATGILVEHRTMSDVSQDLAIRQSELVTRLHRAKIAIGHLVHS